MAISIPGVGSFDLSPADISKDVLSPAEIQSQSQALQKGDLQIGQLRMEESARNQILQAAESGQLSLEDLIGPLATLSPQSIPGLLQQTGQGAEGQRVLANQRKFKLAGDIARTTLKPQKVTIDGVDLEVPVRFDVTKRPLFQEYNIKTGKLFTEEDQASLRDSDFTEEQRREWRKDNLVVANYTQNPNTGEFEFAGFRPTETPELKEERQVRTALRKANIAEAIKDRELRQDTIETTIRLKDAFGKAKTLIQKLPAGYGGFAKVQAAEKATRAGVSTLDQRKLLFDQATFEELTLETAAYARSMGERGVLTDPDIERALRGLPFDKTLSLVEKYARLAAVADRANRNIKAVFEKDGFGFNDYKDFLIDFDIQAPGGEKALQSVPTEQGTDIQSSAGKKYTLPNKGR